MYSIVFGGLVILALGLVALYLVKKDQPRLKS
jgi:hypothetical protein